MTRDELWKLYCERNPQFTDENNEVTLTARGLRKMMEQTWEQAMREAARTAENQRLADDLIRKATGGRFPFS